MRTLFMRNPPDGARSKNRKAKTKDRELRSDTVEIANTFGHRSIGDIIEFARFITRVRKALNNDPKETITQSNRYIGNLKCHLHVRKVQSESSTMSENADRRRNRYDDGGDNRY